MDNYVTQGQCEERRNDIYEKIEGHDRDIKGHDKDIVELKITSAKISTSLESILTIGKAMFGAMFGGMITIIVILLTRGL